MLNYLVASATFDAIEHDAVMGFHHYEAAEMRGWIVQPEVAVVPPEQHVAGAVALQHLQSRPRRTQH
jgi:hypothetical protein